jgi:hypothetical protein
VKLEQDYLESMPAVLWKLLHSMKAKERIRVPITDQVMKEIEGDKYQRLQT